MIDYNNCLSLFGKKFSAKSGIQELMEDLGQALLNEGMLMLGGGNPAHITEVEAVFQKHLEDLVQDKKKLSTVLGNYDPPGGNTEFISSLVSYFNENYNFNITAANIAITGGSQSAFFILFNLFAGRFPGGQKKQILLPYVPEYIGYTEQGMEADFFTSCRPLIDEIDDQFFKYRIDFDRLTTAGAGAICVSRPTNPSGNVITDDEVDKLYGIAAAAGIPLIIDNAYGNPFPGVIFSGATLKWRPGMVLVMSLSKMGLPGTRTGIIIGDEEMIQLVSAANAVISLANSNIGQSIAQKLLSGNQITDLARDIIRPFYETKSRYAISLIQKEFAGIDYRIHVSEGAFFLWIWFKNLPVTSRELYETLKVQKVIIVPGEYFFPGLTEEWDHSRQCIRLNYAQDDHILDQGIKIIAETIRDILKNLAEKSK